MKNNKNNLNRKGLWLFICMLLVTTSCGFNRNVVVAKPDQILQPSEDMSIIFGRLEIFKDGQLTPAGVTSIPLYGYSISTNTIEAVDISFLPHEKWTAIGLWSRKNFIIRTEQNDRFFIAALPPGRYHIFCYNKEHAIFDVTPKSKTYIGTIRVNIVSAQTKRTKENSINIPPIGGGIGAAAGYSAGELVKEGFSLLKPSKRAKVKKVEIVNDNEKAKEFYHTIYPNIDFKMNTVEKLVELMPCNLPETK